MKNTLPHVVLAISTALCFAQPLDISYQCRSCRLSSRDRERIKPVAEIQCAMLSAASGSAVAASIRFRVFGKDSDYKAYRDSSSVNARSSNGYYSRVKRTVVVNRNRRFLRTCYHESFHALHHASGLGLPVWLNEGLAEYFEMADPGRILLVRPQPDKVSRLRASLAADTAMSFDTLFSLDNARWKQVNRPAHHPASTLAWGVVFYMMADPSRSRMLLESMGRISGGRTSAEGLEECLPEGLVSLRERMLLFYRDNPAPHTPRIP